MDEQGREPVEELTLEPTGTVRARRSPILWAVLAVVGVAAGALVVTSSGDDGGTRRPGLPVELAFGRSGGGEAAADASLAWVTYVAGDDLPSLGGEGTAYRLTGDVDEARVRALADAVGLDGEVQRTEAGWSVTGEGGLGRLEVYRGGGAHWSWYSGHQDCPVEDGSVSSCGEECVVGSDGLERCSKTFSEPGMPVPATTGVACPDDTGDDSDPSQECLEGAVAAAPPAICPPPEAPEEAQGCDDVGVVGAPDSGSDCVDDDCIAGGGGTDVPVSVVEPPEPRTPPDDVARVALDVAAAAGHDVDDAIVTAVTSGGEEGSGQWYVTVEPRLDGVPSGLLTYVEVGSDLRPLSAGGPLGGAVDLGEYPLLDTRAAIERANDQMTAGVGPAVEDTGRAIAGDESEAGAADTTGGTDGSGSTDVGGGSEPSEPTDTTLVEPCAPDGSDGGCGGTTGCGGDGCVDPGTCKVQPDGREICEPVCTDEPDPCTTDDCPLYEEEPVGAPEDGVAVAPPVPSCTPPDPEPVPVPEPAPAPVEIVLVDAERSLVLLPANDGSVDAYLVPAYRFTAQDGGQIDLPAVADDALTGPRTTETTVPDTVMTVPDPVPQPQPCEVLEEGDASGTTHTVQTCPPPDEDAVHHVEAFVMDDHCTWLVVELDGKVWWTPGYYKDDLYGWSQPTEPGTFTIHPDGTADFVADADPEHRATLEPWEGDTEGPLCE